MIALIELVTAHRRHRREDDDQQVILSDLPRERGTTGQVTSLFPAVVDGA